MKYPTFEGKTPYQTKIYKEFRSSFSEHCKYYLVNRFNSEVGSKGWTTKRSVFLIALMDEFIARDIDVSAVHDTQSTSFDRAVFLFENSLKKTLLSS